MNYKRTDNYTHTRRELTTRTYWDVSFEVRHFKSPRNMTTGDAIKKTLEGEKLPPEEWRLINLMHELKFDIVEGNTAWRRNEDELRVSAEVYLLIPYIPKSIYMAKN